MANNQENRQPTPPYIPLKTLTNFVNKLKEKTVPPRIDRTVLGRYSGSVAGALIPALKFLALIDDEGKTSDKMRALVESYGSDTWKETLKKTIDEAYSNIIGALEIGSATKGMLEDEFKKTGAEKSVVSRCMTFYVAALREAGVNVSPHITEIQRGKRDQFKKKTPKIKPEQPADALDGEKGIKDIPGTVQFNIPVLPGKSPITVVIPKNISDEEWNIVDITMKGYISLLQLQRKKEEEKK
jgi:hypothetical protein